MLFSCKITHSVITYLDKRGEDLEALYEKCDWPAEFLHDPSSWLEADKMEAFLKLIETEYSKRDTDESRAEDLFSAVGHQCKDLRAWGVLDSVLRMVQTPKELFAQPERFLSYFVSPAPPVGTVRREAESVSFVSTVSEKQFPRVTDYLRAALEALPTYISKPMANVSWENARVTISWSESQASLFGEREAVDVSLHPELVRNILHNLESSQKQLEETKRALISKESELKELQARSNDLPVNAAAVSHGESSLAEGHPGLSKVVHDLHRLGDYIARGQQLITLLVGQGRQTRQVQEAMRRVDWDFVVLEGPQTVKRIIADIQAIQEGLQDEAVPDHNLSSGSAQDWATVFPQNQKLEI